MLIFLRLKNVLFLPYCPAVGLNQHCSLQIISPAQIRAIQAQSSHAVDNIGLGVDNMEETKSQRNIVSATRV
jgi:hypothetical protein